MTFSISRSSISLSCASLISPLACLARASFSGAVRNRLPTWSARNGALVRCMTLLAPYFIGELDDLAQLRPLLVLSEHIAFFGRGEATLRREAELLDRSKL